MHIRQVEARAFAAAQLHPAPPSPASPLAWPRGRGADWRSGRLPDRVARLALGGAAIGLGERGLADELSDGCAPPDAALQALDVVGREFDLDDHPRRVPAVAKQLGRLDCDFLVEVFRHRRRVLSPG